MKSFVSTFFHVCLALLCLSLSATAEDVSTPIELKPVAELYTSQACGKCPKGNQRFADFATSENVIGLTFSVDYWDYMGWKDTRAMPEFSARQAALNEAMHRRGPYTPQVIFNGTTHTSALKTKRLKKRLSEVNDEAPDILVLYDGKNIKISDADNTPQIEVLRADFLPGITQITPKGGQNKNEVMSYFNAVTSLTTLGVVPKSDETNIEASCSDSCAFIFQEAASGSVLGAFTYSKSSS
jgi:hypothetical protein